VLKEPPEVLHRSGHQVEGLGFKGFAYVFKEPPEVLHHFDDETYVRHDNNHPLSLQG
jgi:hypothetical protein